MSDDYTTGAGAKQNEPLTEEYPRSAAEMNHGRRAYGIARLVAAALSSLPVTAWPHAFGERYDLPAPLAYFVASATAVVALSFVVAVLIARGMSRASPAEGLVVALGPLLPALRLVCRIVSVIFLALVVVAGLFGTRNPEMNLAPTLVWIIGWVGLSLVVACIGNIWPALDPWRTLFETMDALARRVRKTGGIALGWTYPQALGAWPAVILLLMFAWLEVVYLQASVPSRIAYMLLAWSALTLLGMVCFGREAWQRNADVFAIYFATLGRFAPVGPGPDARSIVLRPMGRGLIASGAVSTAMVGFVIAMLSTVLFDGLLGGQVWWLAQRAFTRWMPRLVDDSGYWVGTIGLIAAWLLFFAAYLADVPGHGTARSRPYGQCDCAPVRADPGADRGRLQYRAQSFEPAGAGPAARSAALGSAWTRLGSVWNRGVLPQHRHHRCPIYVVCGDQRHRDRPRHFNMARASRGAARVRRAAQGRDRIHPAHGPDGGLYRHQPLGDRRAAGSVPQPRRTVFA